MSSSRFYEINDLLDHFQDHQKFVNSRKTIVNKFLGKLSSMLNWDNDFITKGSKFKHVGSSAEKTVVSPSADFDVAMIPPACFSSQFFEVVETDDPGLYKLRETSDENRTISDEFFNSKNFLKVTDFRDEIFYELETTIREIDRCFGFKITFTKMASSFRVFMKKENKEDIHIDIVPQIAVSIDDIPDWNDEIELKFVGNNYKSKNNVYLSLSSPPNFEKNYEHLIVQPCFALLEKEYIDASVVLADSVRIAKKVAKYFELYGKGLRSFHLKRVAIAMVDEIEECDDPWDGYKIILRELKDMLKDDYIEGFFIVDQDLWCKDTSKELIADITRANRYIQPNNILKRFGYEI